MKKILLLLSMFLLISFLAGCKTAGKATDTTWHCNDSDNGINYTSYGAVTGDYNGIPFYKDDICFDDRLTEYYCDGVSPITVEVVCFDGCQEGRCLSNDVELSCIADNDNTF